MTQDRTFIQSIRSTWIDQNLLQEREACRLENALYEFDLVSERISGLLRNELLASAAQFDLDKMGTAIADLSVRLWQAEEFAQTARALLDDLMEQIDQAED